MKTKSYTLILICLLIMSSYVEGHCQSTIVEPIPNNSPLKNDFAPYVKDSVLYFSSNRKHELIKTYLDQNNEGLYRLYKAQLKSNDDYGKEQALVSDKLSKLNTATISYSQDGSKIFITQNEYATLNRSKGRENLLGIFIIENNNGKWSRPYSFPYNSRRNYSTAHPTVTPDGNTLFFVSNMPGGFGKTDLYQSTFMNGEWSEPVNLGKNINTEGHELFPYYHPSGKLYFSSDKHGSKGGLDIFYIRWDGNEWSKPIQLEKPINSENNDFSCYVFEDETEGYFASDRSGNDDIYKFSNPFPTFPDAKPQVEDNFCFTLFENGPFKSDTLPYIYQWYFGDGSSAKGLEVQHCFPGPGMYNVHLNVVDTLANVDLYTVAQYELELEQTQQIYISAPDTVAINTPVTFSAEKSVLKNFEPTQYYWDFGDNNKAKGVTINHIFQKKGIYHVLCGAISLDDYTNKMSSTCKIVVTE